MRLQCFPPTRYVKTGKNGGERYLEKFSKLEYRLFALYGSTVHPRLFTCFVWLYCAS